MNIGNQLREIRKMRALTQKELASLAGVAQSVVSNAENGEREPTLDSLAKLCKVLNLTLSDFFTMFENQTLTSTVQSELCLSEEEILLIKKYRSLASRDKETIGSLVEILSKQKESTSQSLILNGDESTTESNLA